MSVQAYNQPAHARPLGAPKTRLTKDDSPFENSSHHVRLKSCPPTTTPNSAPINQHQQDTSDDKTGGDGDDKVHVGSGVFSTDPETEPSVRILHAYLSASSSERKRMSMPAKGSLDYSAEGSGGLRTAIDTMLANYLRRCIPGSTAGVLTPGNLKAKIMMLQKLSSSSESDAELSDRIQLCADMCARFSSVAAPDRDDEQQAMAGQPSRLQELEGLERRFDRLFIEPCNYWSKCRAIAEKMAHRMNNGVEMDDDSYMDFVEAYL